ncbi:reverse transcriptase [Gossypium australe]|uniref:Reverse transcriptase n=1 Tax=Gossypium australe TaxID=47621 RepID=A0A5B6VCS1_9ROSI|nr:reverse transcriptase [Gossypium australe]
MVGGKEKDRVWSRLAWDQLCHPKGMGGLGFRDFHIFNIALLGRQVWRLLTCKETLCYEVLSAKYFPNGYIFHPKNVDKPSFTWLSISKAAEKLKEGFGWTVGNGRSINIRRDCWGSRVCLDRLSGWTVGWVAEIYGEKLKDQICNLPFSHAGHEDQRAWFHNPSGFFSSKSAYSWMILRQIGFGPYRIFWKLIWKLNTLLKVRLFCWRLGHKILPTFEKIAGIRSDFDSLCPRCGNERESHMHAMRDCPFARKEQQGTEDDARAVWDRASCLNRDFRIHNLVEKSMLPIPGESPAWKKPEAGVMKINFDVAFLNNKAWFGLIARDNDGFVYGGRMGSTDKVFNAKLGEYRAMEESINFAHKRG